MKKTFLILYTLIICALVFVSCEDPYANQEVASPGNYDQENLQASVDSNFVVVVKSGVSPVTVVSNQLADSLSLFTCTSIPTLVDTAASVTCKLQISNTSGFTSSKILPISFNGKQGSDIKVNYSNLSDSVKAWDKAHINRTIYARIIAYVVKEGTKVKLATKTASFDITPYNFPPVAKNDTVTVGTNEANILSVLINDTDIEGNALTITSVTNPSNGTVSISADKKTITFISSVDGSDSFTYTISDGNGGTSTAKVVLAVSSLKPYTAVTPKPYYIIGMANGAWNNSASGLGISIYPMTVLSGSKYNANGDGIFTFTGYFWASRGFKLIRNLGDWNEQWGIKDGVFVHNDGGSSDIKVAADGYYTITLNSITNTMTMAASAITPTSYAKIGLIGGFNGWGGDIVMSPCEASNNHNWYTTVTFTGDDQGKFRANGGWDMNWGTPSQTADGDPLYSFTGIGKKDGKNIGVKAGTYTVLFNDIDGGYWFFKQ